MTKTIFGLAALLLPLVGCAVTPATMPAGGGSFSTAAIRSFNKAYGDYLPAHNVQVSVDGVIAGSFQEVSGLDSQGTVIEYRNGDDPITHKRPGKAKYKNIVLKRGVVNDPTLLAWYKKVLAGKTDRKSGSIIYLDREGNERKSGSIIYLDRDGKSEVLRLSGIRQVTMLAPAANGLTHRAEPTPPEVKNGSANRQGGGRRNTAMLSLPVEQVEFVVEKVERG